MLTSIQDRLYVIYPSWARLPFDWETLPAHLSNPLESSLFPQNVPLEKYSTGRPEIEYLPGPCGGGVIVPHIARDEWWLGWPILTLGNNICTPPGMPPGNDGDFGSRVVYLEPYDNLPEVQLGLAKRPRLYVCMATTEHAEAAGSDAYWLASTFKNARAKRMLDEVPEWAAAFGIELERLDRCPGALRGDEDMWFVSGEFEPTWYRATTSDHDAGWHFAVLLYVALHARSVCTRLQSMHLVAQIEGAPRYRHALRR